MLNSDGEEIDLLQQELEKVGHDDPTNINSESIRERTSSLALTIASDSGVENEKLLGRHQILKNLSNLNKFNSDNPMNSDRITPTLTDKRRNLFRSATTTTSPSSLNDDNPSSKNPSLT
jgi:hypothetical protein